MFLSRSGSLLKRNDNLFLCILKLTRVKVKLFMLDVNNVDIYFPNTRFDFFFYIVAHVSLACHQSVVDIILGHLHVISL